MLMMVCNAYLDCQYQLVNQVVTIILHQRWITKDSKSMGAQNGFSMQLT